MLLVSLLGGKDAIIAVAPPIALVVLAVMVLPWLLWLLFVMIVVVVVGMVWTSVAMGVVVAEEVAEEGDGDEEPSLADRVMKQPESIPACGLFLDRTNIEEAEEEDPDIDKGLKGAADGVRG